MKTVIEYNEDGLRVERPHKEPFSTHQRFLLSLMRWGVVGGILCMFLVFRSCGGTLI